MAAVCTLTKAISPAQLKIIWLGTFNITTLQRPGIVYMRCLALVWVFGGFCCFSSENLTQGTPYLHLSVPPNLAASHPCSGVPGHVL